MFFGLEPLRDVLFFFPRLGKSHYMLGVQGVTDGKAHGSVGISDITLDSHAGVAMGGFADDRRI